MKKILALILALVMIMSLAACGSEKPRKIGKCYEKLRFGV